MAAVQVMYFGPAQDAAGVATEQMEIAPNSSLGQLAEAIFARHPRLASGRAALRFAVNGELAPPECALHDGDEVAAIPPVSGGEDERDWVALVDSPIDPARVWQVVSGDPALGGVVTFAGSTRAERRPDQGQLVRLEYQAYDSMALAEMRRLAAEARRRWPVGRLALVHRTGAVELGDASVMIAVACPHRAAAFEACRWLIDTLKVVVPIWKREIWENGESTWVDPTRSGAGDEQA